jgi:fermentation-respiration switch protein FrsA (DUF1100 family)
MSERDKSMRTNVTFDSAGLALAGHLYTPDDAGTRAPARPAVVVGHPGSGVKEQAAGLYARRLAENGFVTLAFDAAYQGESEGLPRGLEDPAHRVEDLKAAVTFLATRGTVDPGRVGVLGICASGGYALTAAATDHRVRAVASVSGADIARQFRLGADGAQDPAVIQRMLDAAATARTEQASGAGVQCFPLFPDTIEQAREVGGEHGAEGFEYYCTERGQHPRSVKLMPWSSVDHIAGFDSLAAVDLIAPRPLLLVAGCKAVTSWMSVEAYQRAGEPKELLWIDDASHVDLYDKDEHVSTAVARLSDFFAAHLAAAVPVG